MPKARQGGATPEKGSALWEIALNRWSGAKKQWIVFSQYASMCMYLYCYFVPGFDPCSETHMQLAMYGAAGVTGGSKIVVSTLRLSEVLHELVPVPRARRQTECVITWVAMRTKNLPISSSPRRSHLSLHLNGTCFVIVRAQSRFECLCFPDLLTAFLIARGRHGARHPAPRMSRGP